MEVQGVGAAEAPGLPRQPGWLERRVLGGLVRTVYFRGRRGGPWPDPPGTVPVLIPSPDRGRLSALHCPVPAPRAIAVLVHPDRRYGKHWFVRQGWMEWLAAHGVESLAFDLPMYGGSRGGSPYLHEHVAAAVVAARGLRPGLPLHVVGLSIGAFAAINAAPALRGVASYVLESPYPSFTAWYGANGSKGVGVALDRGLRRLFPRTYRRIDAASNVRSLRAPALIAAATHDPVTPAALTRLVAAGAPRGTRFLELPRRDHLHLFEEPAYREAILEVMGLAPRAKAPQLHAVAAPA
jgi:alpha-beta hydrolase superfamily lysophospholipase